MQILSKDNIELNKAFEEFQLSCQVSQEHMAKKYICHQPPTHNDIYSDNLLADIEMFTTFNGDGKDTLFNQLGSQCMTSGGRVYLETLIKSPICDIKQLRERQDTLQALDGFSNKKSRQILKMIKAHESDFLWLFQQHNEVVQDIYQMVYYRSWLTSWINGDSRAITGLNIYTILVSPLIGILSPIVYFIMPYLVIRFKLGINVSFYSFLQLSFKAMFISTTGIFGSTNGGIFDNLKYISYGFSLIFYFQSLFNSVELSNTVYKISGILTDKVNKIVNFVRNCKTLVTQYWNPDIAKVFGCDVNHHQLPNTFDAVSLDAFSLCHNFGSRLQIFKEMNPNDYIPMIQQLYMMDAIWAIQSKLLQDSYSYVKFDDSTLPIYDMVKMWHPCIPKARVVYNDVQLGGKSPIRNMLITGPNAGGKSTIIKAILCNAVVAQTLTIVAAKTVTMTPFHLIHSQINVPDCKGKESLFEAEMHRCKDSMDLLSKCKGPSLVVMDEIFNSTNPVEGVAGAYAIAKRIGSHETNLTVISTHYMYLTKIIKEVPSFANFKMRVKKVNDDITFPYKLSKGVCTQFIALELLKKNGFHPDLIEDALQIKAQIIGI